MLYEPTDNKSHLHCRRCDFDYRRLIKFKSPDNKPYYRFSVVLSNGINER